MKRKFLMIFAVLFVLGIFYIALYEISKLGEKKDYNIASDTDAETTTDNNQDFYSYSQVEDIVAYLANDSEQKKSLDRLVDPLTKSNYIDVAYMVNVVEVINAPVEVYSQILLGMSQNDYITREQFEQIYSNIVDLGIVENLERQDIFVYNVISSVSDEGNAENSVYDGSMTYGLDIEIPEEYENKIINVYIKEGNIFKINGLSNTTVTFKNAWLISADNSNCTFIYNGSEKTFNISEITTDSDALNKVTDGSVVEITLDNTGIISINEYKDIIRCRVVEVDKNTLELDENGTVTISDDIKIYDISNGEIPVCENSIPILKGHSQVQLVSDGEKIIAAVIEDELVTTDIRVILSNNSYSSYKMSEVTVSSDTSYKVIYPDDSEAVRTSGKTVTIKYDDYENGDIITIKPIGDSGKIQIQSLQRNYGNPEYNGTIEIRIFSDGLHIINELPLETYLYSVVSSEMPSNSSEEALNAMAICARAYAYSKMEDESFEAYNAHLDDSTLCQVYNNIKATEESIKAVKDTYGIVPVYEENVIVPFYFSTSCGVTCTNEEIWGGSAYPYLESNLETLNKDDVDLSVEEDFIKFIKDGVDYDIIDKDMPYYRWSISFTEDEISEAVNSMLEERINASSDNIKIKSEDGTLSSTDITDIGQIKSIKVIERSKSGVVNTLEIEGTEATIQVSGQTNIRNIITPVNQQIIRQDETVVTGWTSLPSPYYYIEEVEGGYIIYGGGFGHGVGMSQTGADVLAKKGYNYKYILKHYYSNIDFASIYTVESKKAEE